jgi:hypothetical protein
MAALWHREAELARAALGVEGFEARLVAGQAAPPDAAMAHAITFLRD